MTKDAETHEVADNVFAFSGTEVNWVIIRSGSDLTLIDAGWQGDTQEVERSIRSLGRRPEDLRAVLLTHAHADHTGALNHLHDNYGVSIYMDRIEVANARGENVETGGPLDVAKRLYRPQVARWATQVVKAGGLHQIVTPAASAFPRTGALDLPGRPVPIPTPGHTSGHTSYLLPEVGVVVTGDALVSGHPTLNGLGPRLLPAYFTHDQRSAIESLHTLWQIDAETFVPGHGPAWFGPLRQSVDQALDKITHKIIGEKT